MEPSLVGEEGSYEASDLGFDVGSLVGFSLEVRVLRWDPQKGGCLELHVALSVVWVEDCLLTHRSPPGILVATSRSPCHPIHSTPCP